MMDPAGFMKDLLHMWTNPDQGERLEVIRSHFTADVQFHDADGDFEGETGLETFSASLRERFPDARFRLVAPPDVVGDGIRAFWTFGPEDHPDAVHGMDFVLWDGWRARALYAFVSRPAER
jgi:hypothetical protein